MTHDARATSVEDLFYGVVTIGERGQVVVPAAARKAHNLHPGDKLLVFRHPHVAGLVVARLDEIQNLLDDLQQWRDFISGVAEDAREAAQT